MLEKQHKKTFPPQEKHLNTKIINFTQSTTEKIEKKHLSNFFKNIITSNDYKLSFSSKVFYTFFKKSNIYEIYLIDNYTNKDVPLPCIFIDIHNINSNELFITKNFFILYSKGNFKLLKEKTNEISEADIVNYIKHQYQLDIDKVHKITEEELNTIFKNYLKNNDYTNLELLSLNENTKSFYLFAFIFLCLVILTIHYSFYLPNNNTSKTDKTIRILEKKYANLGKVKEREKTNYIVDILSLIKKYSLDLKSINLNKDKLHIFLESKEKLNLLEFVNKYDGNIKINKLSFKEKSNKFDMEAIIVF